MLFGQSAFWISAGAGAVVAGWWLSVRPGASGRDLASPISFLALLLAVLICLLTLTGQDVRGFARSAYSLVSGS